MVSIRYGKPRAVRESQCAKSLGFLEARAELQSANRSGIVGAIGAPVTDRQPRSARRDSTPSIVCAGRHSVDRASDADYWVASSENIARKLWQGGRVLQPRQTVASCAVFSIRR